MAKIYFEAMAGDLEGVKKALRSGADINEKDPDGLTTLMNGIISGNRELVMYLLENGADVHPSSTLHGWTALHYASDREQNRYGQGAT